MVVVELLTIIMIVLKILGNLNMTWLQVLISEILMLCLYAFYIATCLIAKYRNKQIDGGLL